jgi:DNA-binding NtrC family response regulator
MLDKFADNGVGDGCRITFMSKGQQPTTLVVLDDDPESLREISAVLSPHYRVLTTSDPRRAMGWVENDASVGILIVEQVLRSGLGLDVLEKAHELRPNIRRIMITRYEDLNALVAGLHKGTIHRMISKPLLKSELVSLAGAMPSAAGGQSARLAS